MDISENTKPQRAYTTWQWVWAVNLSALVGGLGFATYSYVVHASPIEALPKVWFGATLWALPIVWLSLSLPLWTLMEHPVSRWRAVVHGSQWSAVIAGLVGLAAIVHGFVDAQGKDGVTSIRGFIASYEWWAWLKSCAAFVAACALAALIVRQVMGPGRHV